MLLCRWLATENISTVLCSNPFCPTTAGRFFADRLFIRLVLRVKQSRKRRTSPIARTAVYLTGLRQPGNQSAPSCGTQSLETAWACGGRGSGDDSKYGSSYKVIRRIWLNQPSMLSSCACPTEPACPLNASSRAGKSSKTERSAVASADIPPIQVHHRARLQRTWGPLQAMMHTSP